MKKPFTNLENHTVFVGGVMIGPGQTRDVDPDFLPPATESSADEAPYNPSEQQHQDPGVPLVPPGGLAELPLDPPPPPPADLDPPPPPPAVVPPKAKGKK